MLLQIASELDAASDPKLIQKCADYFCTNQQFDKAVDLLAVGKKVSKLCCTISELAYVDCTLKKYIYNFCKIY